MKLIVVVTEHIPTLVFTVLAAVQCGGCGNSYSNNFNRAVQEAILNSSSDLACGPLELAPLIPDCPVDSACFIEACENHNVCYRVCDVSKAECDDQFFNDMIAICTQSFTLMDEQWVNCRYTALIYWLAVDRFGQESFDETQASSCDFDYLFPDEPGACCTPGPPIACADVENRFDCRFDALFIPGLSCDEVTTTFGGCPVPAEDKCEDAPTICSVQQPDEDLGRCAPARADDDGDVATGDEPQSDTSEPGAVCSIFSQDCFGEVPCLPIESDAFRCVVPTDNRLATTDGPEAGGDCTESGPTSFQADVWFEYVAPCSGTMSIQMCNAGLYDSMLAVHGSNQPDEACTCPTDNEDLLACNDDFCDSSGSLSGLILDGVVEGACYTIRVGGWSRDGTEEAAQRDLSELDIGVICDGDD